MALAKAAFAYDLALRCRDLPTVRFGHEGGLVIASRQVHINFTGALAQEYQFANW